MAIGHNLSLRLFLEGIEVPVIGASVQIAANVPASASIQVIATDKILSILPRTVVHLFFYDFVEGAVNYGTVVGDLKDAPGQGYFADQVNKQYKLLFMGEVQGLQFTKDTGNRSVVLNCVDFSNYWDTTYQYNFKGSLLGGRKHAAFIGANANLFTSPLGHGVGTIAALLNGRSANFPDLKGLLAGIVRILEAIGGSYYGETTFRGANDFTSIAELRLKILQQITAAEKDTSTRKLFARKTFNMWMNRQMGSLGKLVTFRGLTRILQKFVFHEIYPCPAARYVPKVEGLKKKKVYATPLHRDPRARAVIVEARKMLKLNTSAKTNLDALSATTPNSVGSSPSAVALSRDLQQLSTSLNKAVTSAGANLPGVARHLTTISGQLSKIKAVIGAPGRGFFLQTDKLGQATNRNKADNQLQAMNAEINTLLGKKLKKSRTVTYDKLDRVNNQILRPDIWFAPAPRCNVLFPELYGNFSWSRNFLREVSRIELQTTNEILGDDALFNGRYYAPNVKDMRRGLRLSSRRFSRLIMSHELLTGIIPMYEKISEANLFAMRSRAVKHKGAKVSLAQRVVNHQYFKHRFASRGMQAAGRFNPWFVCGFPALLIDRTMDATNLAISGLGIAEALKALDIIPAKGTEITRSAILQQLVPVQYVGSCVQLSHTLNQQGGNTAYAFAQARVHREDTEFLGVDKATVSKKLGTSTRTYVVAVRSGSSPKKGSRGRLGGKILSIQDVTNAYLGRRLPLLGTRVRAVVGDQFNDDGSLSSSIDAVRIKEEFTRRARVKIDLPIEDAIRPPWIWDGWNNLKIGQTYMQFFGVNALTDVEGVTSKDLLETLVGADSLQATLDTKEGYTYGTGTAKDDDTADQFLDQLGKDKKNDNRRNKPQDDVTGADAKVSAATILAIEEERTIENAIDFLVRTYSFIRAHQLDVGNFIRNYTWRPVATMPEILGSADFTIEEKTKLQLTGSDVSDLQLSEVTIDGEYAISGKEGFHSRAFGDKSDLFGLVDGKVKKVLGLSKEKRQATAKRLDVRARRRAAVQEYVAELENSRGLMG